MACAVDRLKPFVIREGESRNKSLPTRFKLVDCLCLVDTLPKVLVKCRMTGLGQFLMGLSKNAPSAETVMGLRQNLCNSHLYTMIRFGCNGDWVVSRHCMQPILE
ncbi:hypothetical protein HanHA300_Chr17g0660861 [Helianthus annuus]|nr:hypothetical protein HanHA300_Chr17g0660861 [Helianthus annuus]